MEDFTKRSTSDNRLLAVVMSNAARLATSIGPGAINPQYWSAINLAMLNACYEAVADREQLRDVIDAQEDEIDCLTAANKTQAARIEALLDTIRTQDRKIAECLMSQSHSIPTTALTESCVPAALNTSNGNGHMPQPASTPVSTPNEATDPSALRASGAQHTGRRYTYPPGELRSLVIERIRRLMAERGTNSLSSSDWNRSVQDLPTVGTFTEILNVKWNEMVLAAGGEPVARGRQHAKPPVVEPAAVLVQPQPAPVVVEEVTPIAAVRFPGGSEAAA